MSRPRFSPQDVLGLAQNQKLAFLAVGGFNTVLGYALYYLFLTRFGFPYLLALVVAYVLSIMVAFVLHRAFVFRVSGNTAQDFVRFVLVNLASLALNAALLPIAVELVGIDPVPAQIIAAAIVAGATYFGHRSFSFRRPHLS